MLEIYDGVSSLTFANGKTYTKEELKDDPNYSIIFRLPCVLNKIDNIVKEITPLYILKDRYSVETSDNETALSEISTKIETEKAFMELNTRIQSSINKAAQIVALSFTDEQALEVPDLYPDYVVDHAYKQNDRFQYNGRLFKVNQNHTSAAQWVPGETGTESLYTCLEMAGDGYLVWTQPTGAHNAYNIGDIVHYPTESDPLYKSLIDGNVWAPDAYPQGWELYTE